jgi:hypothetical protein
MKSGSASASSCDRRRTAAASFGRMAAHRFVTISILFAVACMQPGCAALRKRAEARRKAAAERNRNAEPRLIGIIKLVNMDSGFVLIDSGTNPAPSSDATLKCKSGEVESAELRVSEIRRPPFVIADIVKGTPNKGDFVYQ